jgi:GntR family transcriptional regulator
MIDDLLPQGRSRTLVLELRDQLERAVRSDRMRPGDKLPSEMELASRFAVSRSSVREALKLLEQDGLIDVHHGSGRFVSASAALRVNRPITRFEGVTELLESLGYHPVNEVLSAERVLPTDDERAALGLAAGAAVVRLRRLRRHDGTALMLSSNVFSADLLGGDAIDDVDFSGSLTEWLRSRGHLPVSSAAEIHAAAIPDEVARLPGVDAGKPWLLISERCVDASGAPVLLSNDFHRGDFFAFHVLRRRES